MLFRSMKGPNRFERGAFCSTFVWLSCFDYLVYFGFVMCSLMGCCRYDICDLLEFRIVWLVAKSMVEIVYSGSLERCSVSCDASSR